jgi:guanylate kinase
LSKQTELGRRGLMLVMSSPSGAGKTTIARELLKRDSEIAMSVSATTRAPRPGEKEGKDYFFVTEEEYQRMVAAGEFLEHAKVFNNYYGTPRAAVDQELKAGHDVLFDVDWQGTQQLRENARDDLVSIFVLPPSTDELARRLTERAQDSDDVVSNRMSKASDEMSHYIEYDYIIVNHDVEVSVESVRAVLEAERMKRERVVGLHEFVEYMRDQK